MDWFFGALMGSATLAGALLFSLFYFVIRKYTETLAKLSAEDYYKSKVK